MGDRVRGLEVGGSAVRFEQAVYGSFAFRDQGYAMLAWSPGCRPEWLAGFRAACQNLGERPAGFVDAPGLFALRLESGPWAVVGVSPQGLDDRGRPGALAFHGLFLTPREYRKAGCDPFALAPALRGDWDAETVLAAGVVEVAPTGGDGPSPLAARVAAALAAGRRVALEATEPIDGLAREVWRALPVRVRARASVATWAFGNANRFDLLAAPRLAGLALDASYLDPLTLEGGAGAGVRRVPRALAALGAAVVLAVAGVGLALRGGDDDVPGPVAAAPRPASASAAPAPAGPPPRVTDEAGDRDPAERRRVAEALVDLAERCGVDPGGDPDPAAVMERLARGLRYRGPFLSDADRARLAREPGDDAALALRWDALARRFADDRPLPDGFRDGPLRWQLGVLAWSFHVEGGPRDPDAPRRSASEVAQALAEALASDAPRRPTALAGRHPALASYVAFLKRLPRR